MTTSSQTLPENAYELLVQGVMDYAIYMLDPEGYVRSWNPGAERIKGYLADEILGQHFSRFYEEEDRASGLPQRALRIAQETGRFTAEAWRVRKDGSRFWAMVVIDPIHHGGRLVGFAKITRDMTEQREAHLALLATERRFRLLVQSVTDYAIFMLDRGGYVSNWNAGAERIKGYDASEIVGQHFSRFYTPEDLEAGIPVVALETASRTGRFEAEGWRLRKDGSRFWASVVIDAVHDNGELVGFAKITRDLTERRETQLQLEQSREQLFHAQKMEAVGQLTGGIAHDFNNLLTGLSGSLELLKMRLAQGRFGELDRYIEGALGAAHRAAALTHRLLAFARRQTLDPKAVEANGLIAGMEELIVRTVSPEITLATVLEPELWQTLCDPNQLESALLNLCINARDAMPGGGSLSIATANMSLDGQQARDLDLPPGDYVTITVTDTGTGMAPEVVSRIFDPFFTTKPTGQGTGLGLSMVYGFARQSGGQVTVRSQVGSGTAMAITLPRHTGSEVAETSEPDLGHAPHARVGQTVLVVDDEPTVRMLVTEVLRELGYVALEASDGASGLKLLQSDTRIDLLITDVGLPGGMDGRQLAEAARQLRPRLVCLFVTGYAEGAKLGSGEMGPDTHILAKPFSMEALAARIEELLATG